ncbi:TRAP transporter small permease subunit [Helicobacter apodemus]|uniref:Tripartite ATP-independent periplasmic transporters DctQ component domain-containing protein n=1 Tax=Helicobacter apodemus TaxID=135569 RepID=A0A2U8FDQ0_9HELI|nr:TRAP transporter small permease subunit [Helicobacter apodemus]AWI34256.1 hypothetical protein CDV25_05395 [Helicobacter apodemus]
MQILLRIVESIENISEMVAKISIFLLWILCLLVFALAVALNFSYVNSQLDDFSLYCFALMILLTFSYTLKEDRHVRLDLLKYPKNLKNISWLLINICFILPFSLVIAKYSFDFMMHSYSIGESSPNGKIPYYFIFKSFVVVGFILLALQSIGESLKTFCCLLHNKQKT